MKDGSIINVIVTNENVTIEHSLCSGLVAVAENSNVEECKVEADIVADKSLDPCAGIVGYAVDSKITRCHFSGSAKYNSNSGNSNFIPVAGIVGRARSTDIVECKNIGEIEHTRIYKFKKSGWRDSCIYSGWK